MSDTTANKKSGIVFFNIRNLPCKCIVLRRMGVRKNTFAGNMISRLYDFYFSDAINLRKEYKSFYKHEYDSFLEFLEEHYNIPYEEALILNRGYYAMKKCDIRSVERNVETLNYDRNLKKAFSNAVGGINDEDSDGVYYE